MTRFNENHSLAQLLGEIVNWELQQLAQNQRQSVQNVPVEDHKDLLLAALNAILLLELRSELLEAAQMNPDWPGHLWDESESKMIEWVRSNSAEEAPESFRLLVSHLRGILWTYYGFARSHYWVKKNPWVSLEPEQVERLSAGDGVSWDEAPNPIIEAAPEEVRRWFVARNNAIFEEEKNQHARKRKEARRLLTPACLEYVREYLLQRQIKREDAAWGAECLCDTATQGEIAHKYGMSDKELSQRKTQLVGRLLEME